MRFRHSNPVYLWPKKTAAITWENSVVRWLSTTLACPGSPWLFVLQLTPTGQSYVLYHVDTCLPGTWNAAESLNVPDCLDHEQMKFSEIEDIKNHITGSR